jgi:predicted flap endonuclease-1-like 5' DNA nuclease
MPNASLILETALLFLVAFIIGATIGAVLRRLTMPRPKPAAEPVAVAAPASSGPALVVAPTIAPVAGTVPRRSAAERLAAAAGRDIDNDASFKKPARTAGDATAGVVVPPPAVILAGPPESPPAPEPPPAESADPIILPPPPAPGAPPVEPEQPAEPVVAEAVPPIDEAAQVVERPLPPAPDVVIEPGYGIDPDLGMPVPLVVMMGGEDKLRPAEPEPVAVSRESDHDESAAMRAIEGGDWRPRRATPSRPVQHPEHAGPQEVDTAMATARSAVASATAAAAAAIAESEEAARERRAAAIPLDFEPAREAQPQSFLDTAATAATGGMSFEQPPRAFGQPEGLPSPREGQADNLRQIKGITPQLESSLNQLGIYHFDQIAGWNQKESHWIDSHLSLKGRLAKERWMEQARDLGQGRARTARPVRR